ncbi:DNA primase [Patescibacteria group bacterium]|nr:DNA primase [Patescibacteria group bacterium]
MDNVEEIKLKIDIVDIIAEYLELKKAGMGSYKACCPFHNEKTPSFVVSQDKQIFHCFGCGKGGDAFTFIQEIEGIDFKEALKILAQKAGVELKTNNYTKKEQSKREKILEILNLSSKYYQKLLTLKQGENALEYIKNRGLKNETIKKFKIGYSPNNWDNLYRFLKNKGYQDMDLVLSGMVIKKDNGGYYDRFRNRVMFPISDLYGNVVAFTARTLEKDSKQAKYINSPQTEIYDKSSILFGLDIAKSKIKQKDFVIIVEGQMDLITAVEFGTENIIASSGTALTEKQIKILKRYIKNLHFCFDKDKAGENATERAIEIALKEDMNINIISLEEKYKDPDECIRKDKNSWEESIKNSKPYIDFYFEKLIEETKNKDIKIIKEKLQKFLYKINKLNSEIEKDLWIKKIMKHFMFPQNTIKEELEKIKSNEQNNYTPQKKDEIKPKNKYELSELVISIFINKKETIKILEKINLNILINKKLINIAESILKWYNTDVKSNITEFLINEGFEKNYISYLAILSEKEISDSKFDYNKEIQKYISKLYKDLINKQINLLKNKIKEAENKANKKELQELEGVLIKKIQQLSKIK